MIMEADNDGEGREFDVAKLTANAVARIDVWPLIATGQRMWMRLTGTNANGTAYINDIAPGDPVTQPLIDRGYQNRGITQAAMKNLKDGSTLTIECKTTFNKSTNESEAVAFDVRTYTIKALEDVRPDITRVEDSKGNEILPGATTVDTSIKLKGKGAKGQKVHIKDGTTVKGTADVDPQSGDWEFPLTGLSADTHSFTATAQYGSGVVSDPRIVVVTAPTAPTITRAEDSKGNEILPGATTTDTSITLKGKGAKGQKVLIKDGNTDKGTADVDPLSGDWVFPVAGLTVASHSFTATALYGSGAVSGPRIVGVGIIEDFSSYPPGRALRNAGEFMEGTKTKVTLNATLGAASSNHGVFMRTAPQILIGATYTRTSPNIIAYSLALKQGSAKSVLLNGKFVGWTTGNGHLKLEFRRNDVVVDSIVLYEGPFNNEIPMDRELSPVNGQAFDTLKFEQKGLTSQEHLTTLNLTKVTFKN
ncbi:hypothetical protein CP335_27360 [Pseudomonas fluorescens]|uniref:Bacterial Ig-like domain-containing protein n=1 Tax=Pseudomonas fluorescens TaxID=294 RepID=A0A854X6D2_PSEFL|nr:hypothetical protein CP335_27360 [Pseudomonas fluorescens]